MGFQIGGSILDFVVLGVLQNKDEYGYILTQDVQQILNVSETSMYPALKRLQKNDLLATYDEAFQGRNRRYYKLTDEGRKVLENYIEEWNVFKKDMDTLLKEGVKNGDW